MMTKNASRGFSQGRLLLIIAICLSAFIGLVMGVLSRNGLEGSALLYIGVPTIIALAFTRLSPSKSVMGSTLKAITFVILISGPLLKEGFICMIMAAPLLYIAGALAAWPFDHYRNKNKEKDRAAKLKVVVLPALLVLMSMEGVFEETSFNRYHFVKHTQTIDASVSDIKNRLGENRAIGSPSSAFAKLFPRPDVVNANGLSIGDKHWVDLSYVKWVYWNEKKGSVRFEVVEHGLDYIKFMPVSDDSYISNYLAWGESKVTLTAITEDLTQVTWRTNYQRKLDPAWYMQPLQSYMVGVASELLVASLQ